MPVPTQYVASIAIDDCIDALGAFLQPFLGGAPIVRAQVNRVATPPGAFIKLTELLQVPLETPSADYDGENQQISLTGPKRIDIQVDFYGPSSGDQCAAIETVYRTSYAASQFPAGIAPLYCSNGNQTPLITGEEQYASRWTLTASLQYNPAVVVPQQSATELTLHTLSPVA